MNLNFAYTGIKNITISACLKNVFNRKAQVNIRSGDPAPRGRTLRGAGEQLLS